ncbi:YlzJ-like family protein [Salipaludibacillus agaradhaerens]|uniref:YlzJ-like family protein n=1 Tax=Salipaludibacillus agaradhaerens TaxID=76935 RepID=A0A9Q4B0G2_SALAG|nr:YlzJ-like family protein [Salipaludibacillus agaradhaerens]UJW58094.1 YlzJ-like family protein [Bacillus sp. A116_S68]MCR6096103.1 YlzJ-like family protein [Salipaludibacillus agaradhaerens]MCR6107009.1 YlzJ-like family protein [Salipaludibacillus agaradhaerens]MCR6114338.1 YlzJ-like family protein [Salipaludibacillus agaradhaerens]MCR6119040.1 YlzJ-like family protein [Salipaludibacillus agaradhaerens]
MILYTYQQLDMVFPPAQNSYTSYKMVQIPGGHLILEKEDEGEGYRISRLIATDPNMYLNPHYTPGRSINSN